MSRVPRTSTCVVAEPYVPVNLLHYFFIFHTRTENTQHLDFPTIKRNARLQQIPFSNNFEPQIKKGEGRAERLKTCLVGRVRKNGNPSWCSAKRPPPPPPQNPYTVLSKLRVCGRWFRDSRAWAGSWLKQTIFEVCLELWWEWSKPHPFPVCSHSPCNHPTWSLGGSDLRHTIIDRIHIAVRSRSVEVEV